MTQRPGRLRAALQLLWNGVPVETVSVGSSPNASTSLSGQLVTADSMLQLSAAWACVRLISETIATLPLFLYERTSGGRAKADRHPLYFALHTRPNSRTTGAQFWEAFVASMLLRDGGFAEILRYNGTPVGLLFLERDRLTLDVRAGAYRYLDPDTHRYREIRPADVFRVPGFSLNGRDGLSAIQYGANVFGTSLAAEEASAAKFKHGLAPTVAVEYPTALRAEQRDEARTALQALSGAANAGKGIVLEAGTKAHVVGISPVDAQLLQSRQFGVEEVCRWFKVPPFMVGHTVTSTSWGTGMEQQNLVFLTFTLRPWLTRIEQAIALQLLRPGEDARYYAEFSVEGLLRADIKARAEAYNIAARAGWMSRDEIREKENMPPIPGGNIYTVEANLVALDSLTRGGAP